MDAQSKRGMDAKKTRGPQRKPVYADMSPDALLSDRAVFRYLNLSVSTGKKYRNRGLLPPHDIKIDERGFTRLQTVQDFIRGKHLLVSRPKIGRPKKDDQQGARA